MMHPSRTTFKTVHAPTLRVYYYRRQSRWHWRVTGDAGHVYASSVCGYPSRAAAQHAFRTLHAGLVMGAETVQDRPHGEERSHAQRDLFDGT
jgi:uncharacterized protein YegP (UPF0339 family)